MNSAVVHCTLQGFIARLVVRADTCKGRRAVWTYRVHGDYNATHDGSGGVRSEAQSQGRDDQNRCSSSDLRAAEARQADNAVASAGCAERPRAMDRGGPRELAYGCAGHPGVHSQWSANDSTSHDYLLKGASQEAIAAQYAAAMCWSTRCTTRRSPIC